MGSPAAQAVSAYDGLVWFQSDGEMTREVGCSRQRRGLENSAGSEALTYEWCRAGRAEARWRLWAPFGALGMGRPWQRVRAEGHHQR
jgi:hypothetical protein